MAAITLSEFVANNYNIVYPLQHLLEETHIFLLCEHHEIEAHRKINALFPDRLCRSAAGRDQRDSSQPLLENQLIVYSR